MRKKYCRVEYSTSVFCRIFKNSGGAAMVMALSLTATLAVIGTAAVLCAGSDLLISKRMQRDKESIYASEAVIEKALLSVRREDAELIPDSTFTSPDSSWSIPVQRGHLDRWKYSWKGFLLPDTGDLDGNGETGVVLFNRRFGYSQSPLDEGGYPVFQIVSLTEGGESRKAAVVEVAPVTCDPQVRGAWTAAGPVSIEGNVALSGFDHNLDGELLSEQAGALPAAVSPVAIMLGDGVDAAGKGGVSDASVYIDPFRKVPSDPLEVLNPGETIGSMDDLPAPRLFEDVSGMSAVQGDFTAPLRGEGVMVIHNPRFRPVPYEASRLALERGIFLPEYDPGYSHLDPACQPAVLDLTFGGNFRGVVIADSIAFRAEEFLLVGALLTLSRSPINVAGDAAHRLVYSRSAVERASRGPLSFRLAFKHLPAADRLLSRFEE